MDNQLFSKLIGLDLEGLRLPDRSEQSVIVFQKIVAQRLTIVAVLFEAVLFNHVQMPRSQLRQFRARAVVEWRHRWPLAREMRTLGFIACQDLRPSLVIRR